MWGEHVLAPTTTRDCTCILMHLDIIDKVLSSEINTFIFAKFIIIIYKLHIKLHCCFLFF